MRLARTSRSARLITLGSGRDGEDEVDDAPPNSVPHTRQRAAFSLRRVPQVGQILVFCEEVDSGLIRAEIILDFWVLIFGNKNKVKIVRRLILF
jgi:hypothetical protein